MKPDKARVLAALNRNFAEADDAILKLTAFDRLDETGVTGLPGTRPGFLVLAKQALYNDALGSAIRIFDEHKESGSLWYIMRCHGKAAQKAANACEISIDALRDIVPRLAHIRNKTHFHIDRKALDNPSLIWRNAAIGADTISDALRNAALLLAGIKQEIYGGEMDVLTPYDGSDITRIVRAYAASYTGGESGTALPL